MDNPAFISERTATVSDEWGARDIVLNRSEVRAVRLAADRLGVRMSTTPTGRHVQILLKQAMDLALMYHSRAQDVNLKRGYWSAYVRAKVALGKMQHN